jgi:DUF4097 and DUF4098 domain-containing protein YvlB
MVIAAALLALSLAQAGAAPQTDETVAVQRGARLTVDNFAGDVVVRAWDKDSVRVTARHQPRTRIRIRQVPGGIAVSASSERGPAGSVDYEISVPAWMPIKVSGTYAFVTIEGVEAEVSAESVRGDITVKGGSGFVTAKSVEGTVVVEGAKGKVTASAVNEGVRLTDVSGDINVDSINGSVRMDRVTARSVDASTVNGTIAYQGTISDGGHYSLATHNGDLLLDIPEKSNATVAVRTFDGSYRSAIAALQPPDRSEMRRGRRVTMTMGNGSADVALETFGGSIRIGPGVTSRAGERR